ncbi:Rha family transcriptional regulator [uncultured Paracoccus sp.]|uniref:Rha family transcriptional regulator n=1 Tax=uncultured Paracoccus sp. TaxID=189685 RepID=UPI0025E68478|nr:Rha family transcriptional regulator [uncultured Paracoccus sp.]
MDIHHELITPNLRTTSRVVAEKFGKRHDNVLRDISGIKADVPKEFWLLNFEERDYLDSRGKHQPQIELTRDGFVLLTMGFTGAAAMEWKVRFIEAFNMMEAELGSKLSRLHPDPDAAGADPSGLAGLIPGSLGEIATFVNAARHAVSKAEAARIYHLLLPPALRSGTAHGLLADPQDGRDCLTYLLALDAGGRAVSDWLAEGQDSPMLNRIGLRVRDDGLFVSHQTPVFASSRWSGGRHRAALMTLEGVFAPANPLTLRGRGQRGLVIPLSAIAGGLNVN